jgi:hypothetical protein
MKTASFDLCLELYARSGWELDGHGLYIDKAWWRLDAGARPSSHVQDRYKLLQEQVVAPAYDLGYLLRKLPDGVELLKRDGRYIAGDPPQWRERGISQSFVCPEDALANLAADLFRRNLLTRGASDDK